MVDLLNIVIISTCFTYFISLIACPCHEANTSSQFSGTVDSQTMPTQDDPSIWENTQALLTLTLPHDKNEYFYKITYVIPKSTSINNRDQVAKDQTEQMTSSRKKPIDNQIISIKYLKEEPLIFKFKQQIQYEN